VNRVAIQRGLRDSVIDYLWLSEVAGAMRIARRAGAIVAATATIARTAVVEIKVNGSHPRTP
jgi:hypothetical protein